MARPTPDDLAALDEDLDGLLAVLHPTEALRRVVAQVPGQMGCDKSFAGVIGADGSMRIEHLAGMATDVLRDLRIDPGRGLGGKVLTTERPAWVPDYASAVEITHHYDSLVVGAEGIRGLIAAPLFLGDRLYGVLYAAAPSVTEFGDRAGDHVLATARRASAALTISERALHAAELAALEERRRIALSLHDSVGAMLFALTASVRSLGDDASLDPVLRTKLENIEERAEEATVALRHSVRALSASPEEVALSVTLRADCRAFEERTDVPCRLIVMDRCPPLGPARAAAVVSAVREALVNVEKHAGARSVVVTLFPTDGGVAAAVSDDGVGPGGALAGGRGLGIAASRERLERVGGTWSIAANDDGGTTVRVWAPC